FPEVVSDGETLLGSHPETRSHMLAMLPIPARPRRALFGDWPRSKTITAGTSVHLHFAEARPEKRTHLPLLAPPLPRAWSPQEAPSQRPNLDTNAPQPTSLPRAPRVFARTTPSFSLTFAWW